MSTGDSRGDMAAHEHLRGRSPDRSDRHGGTGHRRPGRAGDPIVQGRPPEVGATFVTPLDGATSIWVFATCPPQQARGLAPDRALTVVTPPPTLRRPSSLPSVGYAASPSLDALAQATSRLVDALTGRLVVAGSRESGFRVCPRSLRARRRLPRRSGAVSGRARDEAARRRIRSRRTSAPSLGQV